LNNYNENRTRSQENQDDEFVRIIPIPSSSHIILNNAIMIAGFPSPGMIGSIVAEQLIEQIGMHQIAYVHSKYVLPGVLWAGGKLRHPFRIYGNEDGSICLLTCDVPITSTGIGTISANIIRWCCENSVNKVVVVSGIFPGNIVPFPQDFAKRTSFLVENDGKLRNDIEHSGGIVNGSETPNFAFIGGVPGQLLAN
jgi:predicted ATP-grasp superfamily ATP-dependent carboligase